MAQKLTKAILRLKERSRTAHKGDFGRVLIVAGSSDYVGAAVLATHAALAVLKTGVDLVTVAAPEHVALVLNCISPSLITVKLSGKYLRPAHLHQILPLLKKADVLLIGPGLGRRSDAVIRKLCRTELLKVIDADAIRPLRTMRNQIHNAIFTPHAEEFHVLTGQRLSTSLQERIRMVQSQTKQMTILLKGPTDIISEKGKLALNTTGNSTMTKGGTGDVLAGFCAGFLARTRDTFRAACMAAYLNGTLGDMLAKEFGSTYLTEDLLSVVHRVWRIP